MPRKHLDVVLDNGLQYFLESSQACVLMNKKNKTQIALS